MPKLELTPRERSALRSAAHYLRPVVLVGDNGLTDAVLKEIDRALTSHGLIKVRAGGDERDAREAMLADICDKLSCAPVHHLGKILILFRPLAGDLQRLAASNAEPGSAHKRRASEPHTPKKLAAAGKTLSKRLAPRIPAQEDTPKKTARVTAGELNKNGKPLRPSTRNNTPHSIPRRAGSSLSLRAGARKGTSRRLAPKR